MAMFICPNCQNRVIDSDGVDGLSHQPAGCARCGFGFLFQLMDDYYPGPGAGMLACDGDGRILASGRGVFELTGYREAQLVGRPLQEALDLRPAEGAEDPVATVLEWGVRKRDLHLTLQHGIGLRKSVRVDLFPGYDADGGLLCCLAPLT